MPRFHFEIVDGYKIEDPVGLDCKNEEQAKTVAEAIASHIAADVAGAEDRTVVIVDDDRVEVFKAPVKRLSTDRRSAPSASETASSGHAGVAR